MGKESIVDISGHKYRYEYVDGKTKYRGPVGDAPAINEGEFLSAISEQRSSEESRQKMRNELNWVLKNAGLEVSTTTSLGRKGPVRGQSMTTTGFKVDTHPYDAGPRDVAIDFMVDTATIRFASSEKVDQMIFEQMDKAVETLVRKDYDAHDEFENYRVLVTIPSDPWGVAKGFTPKQREIIDRHSRFIKARTVANKFMFATMDDRDTILSRIEEDKSLSKRSIDSLTKKLDDYEWEAY